MLNNNNNTLLEIAVGLLQVIGNQTLQMRYVGECCEDIVHL